MPGDLQPLVSNQPITNADGTPTQYFIRWAQAKQIDISGSVSAEQVQEAIDDFAMLRHVVAGRALDGGGSLASDVTIDHAESLVVPGTYGDATKVPRFVVDQEGHVQGVVEVPISGGGGGGGSIMDAVRSARAAAYQAALPGGTGVDLLVTSGNLIGLVFDTYARSTSYFDAVTAKYTVPAGKTAYLVAAYPSRNLVNDPTYYKERLFNVTTGAVVMNANSAAINYNGEITYDNNSTSTTPTLYIAGNAGQTLVLQAAGGPDSIYRTVMCAWVLAVV